MKSYGIPKSSICSMLQLSVESPELAFGESSWAEIVNFFEMVLVAQIVFDICKDTDVQERKADFLEYCNCCNNTGCYMWYIRVPYTNEPNREELIQKTALLLQNINGEFIGESTRDMRDYIVSLTRGENILDSTEVTENILDLTEERNEAQSNFEIGASLRSFLVLVGGPLISLIINMASNEYRK